MHRTPICPAHRTALAAVTRISFTLAGLGAAGCIESPPSAGEPWPDGAEVGDVDDVIDAGEHLADAGPDAMTDVMVDGMSDAIADDPDPDAELVPDLGADGTTDAVVWSETTPCPSPQEDQEAWAACCSARGWNWDDPNCAAWGPPMPPRMLA